MDDRQRANCAGKDPYDSEEQATRMARLISQTTTSGQLYVYRCPVCEAWHLTSNAPRDEPAA